MYLTLAIVSSVTMGFCALMVWQVSGYCDLFAVLFSCVGSFSIVHVSEIFPLLSIRSGSVSLVMIHIESVLVMIPVYWLLTELAKC